MPDYAAALAALADPTRQRIVERLRWGAAAVGELARDLPVSRPAVSQHLAVLKQSGLVSEHRAGRRHIYRLEEGGLIELRSYIDGLWSDVMSAYEMAALSEASRAASEEVGQ